MVVFDAATAATWSFPGTSITNAHTPVGTPTAVALLVYHIPINSASISSVTYGGVACTLADSISDGGLNKVYLYGLANPPAGVQNAVVTISTSDYIGVGIVSVTGSDTTTCFSNHISGTGTGSTASVTCTSVTGELVVDVILCQPTLTVGAGQTERWNLAQSSWHDAASTEAGASSVVMSWTVQVVNPWAQAAASFALPSAGSTSSSISPSPSASVSSSVSLSPSSSQSPSASISPSPSSSVSKSPSSSVSKSPSSSASPSTPPPVPTNTNVSIVGDSITANAGMASFWWWNGILGGHLRIIQNAGIGSEKIAGTLARINNSYTSGSPGLTGLSLGWVVLRIGTNDAAIDSSLASVQSDYDSLIAAILTHCERLVIMAVPPLGTNSSLPQEYNTYLASKAAADPGHITFVDDCTALRTGDTQLSQYFSDGVHPNQFGTLTMGQTASADSTLSALLVQYTDPILTTDPTHVYPAYYQWVTNPTMTGTGGTVGSGFTGVMADNWAIAQTGGVAATVSKVAASGGDSNQTPWQRVALTTGAGGGAIDITTSLTDLVITGTAPLVTYEVALEIRLNALKTVGMADFYTQVTVSGGGVLSPRGYLLCFNSGTVTTSAILRSAFPRVVTGAQTAPVFTLHCLTEQNPASPGSFDFRSVSVTAPSADTGSSFSSSPSTSSSVSLSPSSSQSPSSSVSLSPSSSVSRSPSSSASASISLSPSSSQSPSSSISSSPSSSQSPSSSVSSSASPSPAPVTVAQAGSIKKKSQTTKYDTAMYQFNGTKWGKTTLGVFNGSGFSPNAVHYWDKFWRSIEIQ